MFQLKLFGGASIETPAGPLTGRAAQRHRLALLALLVVGRRSGGVSRDRLIAYLWPETGAERGRRLLADSVYRINDALGEDAIVAAGDELRLDPQRLPSDVARFEAALGRGDLEQAAELVTGPLLDGFFLPDAPEFERWIEAERVRLARAYAGALERLAAAAEARDDRVAAADWWRRAAAHDPYNARIALRLMRALADAGERAAAIQHARVYEMLMHDQLGAEPDADVAALAASLRLESGARTASDRPFRPDAPSSGDGGAARPPATTSPDPGVAGPAVRPARARLRVGLGLALLAAVLLSLPWLVRITGDTSAARAADAAIAVLPFADVSPGRDFDYFADGITEELINTLSGVEGVRVASRTSVFAFKGQGADVREIADRLGVAAVLEGSVRRDGDRLRITAQLIDAANGYHLWSDAYDRQQSSVFEIQEEISRAIVETLKGRLIGRADAAAIERPAVDAEAYNLYLQGRYHWHQRTEQGLRRAAQAFEQAVARAPDYARAHVGMADAYAVLGFYDYLPPRESFPRADAAARQALRLQPDLAEAHATLGYVSLYYHWDWPRAEREFRRAIELAPAYSTAHQWYANFLTAMGRFDEAERAMRRAQELDPLSLIANAALGWVLYYAGRYEDAIDQCRRTLELNAGFELAHYWSGLALEELGRLDEAAQAFTRAIELSGGSAIIVAALARTRALAGQTDQALDLLERLERGGAGGYVPAYELAKVHLALGRRGEAVGWLGRAYAQRSHSMAFLRVDPQLEALRADPEFQDLARRVGH